MSSLFSSRNVIFDESHLARASVEADKEKQEETGGSCCRQSIENTFLVLGEPV